MSFAAHKRGVLRRIKLPPQHWRVCIEEFKMRRYTRKEAARYLTVSGRRTAESSLSTLANRGGGPRFFRCGRRVYYEQAHLDDWLFRQTSGPYDSTSTPAGSKLVAPEPDAGDLEDAPASWETGDPLFDEITRVLGQDRCFPPHSDRNEGSS